MLATLRQRNLQYLEIRRTQCTHYLPPARSAAARCMLCGYRAASVTAASRASSRLAGELKIAYNTARSRLDDIVEALGYSAPPEANGRTDRRGVLDRLAAKEI